MRISGWFLLAAAAVAILFGIVVVQARQKFHRVVEVHVLVVVVVAVVAANVVRAAHRNHAVEQVGAAEQLIGRVIRAEARARRDDADAPLAVVPDVRHDFVSDVAVVFVLAEGLVLRGHLAVEPRLGVDAVDREDLDFAAVNELPDGLDEVEALVLQIVRRRRGEHQQRETVMPIRHDFHVLVQAWAVPAIQKTLHRCPHQLEVGD